MTASKVHSVVIQREVVTGELMVSDIRMMASCVCRVVPAISQVDRAV